MKKRLTKKQSEVFKKKLAALSVTKRKEIESHIHPNDDGSIDLLETVLIASIASDLLESHDDTFSTKSNDSFSGGEGNFDGGGASESYSSGSEDSSGDSESGDTGEDASGGLGSD